MKRKVKRKTNARTVSGRRKTTAAKKEKRKYFPGGRVI